VPLDMLDRLCLDPGTRTIGEFVQEREWAAGEIRRLSLHILRMRQRSPEKVGPPVGSLGERLDSSLNAHRLLRLKEVSALIGLCRSAIYQYVAEGRFPAPVGLGLGVCGAN
jgi:predicted DNA-binding transcriptional regulator AlpA